MGADISLMSRGDYNAMGEKLPAPPGHRGSRMAPPRPAVPKEKTLATDPPPLQYNEFETGAVRDGATGKPLIGNISPFFLNALGAWLARNAKPQGKYDAYNWEAGFPVRYCWESMMRHLNNFARGEVDEPHLAAGGVNLMWIVHVLAMADMGGLPKELDDRVRAGDKLIIP